MKQSNKTSHISSFLKEIQGIHETGSATEHSYRSSIEKLFQQMEKGVSTINEPKRIECGAPDISILRNSSIVGYVEGKDLGTDLGNLKGRDLEQLIKYRNALPNLILSNCLDWDYYRDGKLVSSVSIGELNGAIGTFPDRFEKLASLLKEFLAQKIQNITEPIDLAHRMAGKARLIKEILHMALDLDKSENSELAGQFEAFRKNLISDISIEDFSETYAETITYGMFAARLRDKSPETFDRKNAMFLIPKSNPFLRNLFGYIAGPNLDDRLAWIIDDLVEVFKVSDMDKVMKGFGKLTGHDDPFIHFYETFLAAYNPSKRKMRGVWYTPEPVVKFIVRSVDEILCSEFDLEDGLADTSKVPIEFETGQREQTKKGRLTGDGRQHVTHKDVHRVQILDPCTGTGTFLAEVVRSIAPTVKKRASSLWSNYVKEDLIPRLHGFELLMASYAMCHMKLDMILEELGFTHENSQRLSVYLTNSLEEGAQADQTFSFDQWLVREAKAANTIKRDMPIMCVIGNPPYLGEGGATKGWIGDLLNDYKKEPGGRVKLKEKNPKWLNDLYIKFIRLASHLIEKNGEGIMGFITNHGYLDSNTFRGMRWHLLKTFDRIWVLDLHGNVMRKEVSDAETQDQNVFDIRQGVSIIIAFKKRGSENELAELWHGEMFGSRNSKYEKLKNTSINDPLFKKIETRAPYFPLIEWNYKLFDEYQNGFPLNEFMPVNSVGIVTARDNFTIAEDRDALWQRMQNFAKMDSERARSEFKLGKDVRDWRVDWAQEDVRNNFDRNYIVPINYRPFDVRWTYYTGNSRGLICYPRHDVMRHLLEGENVGLIYSRQVANDKGPPVNAFITKTVFDGRGVYTNKGISQVSPLYIYPPDGAMIGERSVNFKQDLFEKLCRNVEKSDRGRPDEWAVFDYIYGVLFCQSYHEKYGDFLRMDFPRIPWPKNPAKFWEISDKGGLLRTLHLSTGEIKGKSSQNLIGIGKNIVDRCEYENNRIRINRNQYFEDVPEELWNLHIGGYKPAQQWLKDRKGQVLSYDNVKHYLRILFVLEETLEIMQGSDI